MYARLRAAVIQPLGLQRIGQLQRILPVSLASDAGYHRKQPVLKIVNFDYAEPRRIIPELVRRSQLFFPEKFTEGIALIPSEEPVPLSNEIKENWKTPF